MVDSAPAETAPDAPPPRKIIHVDMDAFFASVEQRDNPELRGKPVAVGGGGPRGVVAAASYEARVFGVRSAMPGMRARRLCPDLIFVPHRFDVYREVSRQVRGIFERFTDIIQPLSLDEAYLDVTSNKPGIVSATYIAQEIRRMIFDETGLTASAGVSYNKFIAKLASDQNKPDGLCVIRPEDGADFVATLPVRRFHGVGPVTAQRMQRMGIETGADLRNRPLEFLRQHFGKSAEYYYWAARGRDDRPVRDREERKSVSVEDTFADDFTSEEDLSRELLRLIDRFWPRMEKAGVNGRTVTLKMRFSDFSIITRSRSLPGPVSGIEEFRELSLALLRAQLPPRMGVRLLGIGLHNLTGEDEDGVEGPEQLNLAI